MDKKKNLFTRVTALEEKLSELESRPNKERKALKNVMGEMETMQRVVSDVMTAMEENGFQIQFGATLAPPNWKSFSGSLDKLITEDVPFLAGAVDALTQRSDRFDQRLASAGTSVQSVVDNMADLSRRVDTISLELAADFEKSVKAAEARLGKDTACTGKDDSQLRALVKALQQRLNSMDEVWKKIQADQSEMRTGLAELRTTLALVKGKASNDARADSRQNTLSDNHRHLSNRVSRLASQLGGDGSDATVTARLAACEAGFEGHVTILKSTLDEIERLTNLTKPLAQYDMRGDIRGVKGYSVDNRARIELLEQQLAQLNTSGNQEPEQLFDAVAVPVTIADVPDSPKCFGRSWDPFDDTHCAKCALFQECARASASKADVTWTPKNDEETKPAAKGSWYMDEPDEVDGELVDVHELDHVPESPQVVVIREQEPRSWMWTAFRLIEFVIFLVMLGALIFPKL
ncbi:MAG: hypothetical protein KDB07_06965 [Planctomycetes bacterium]|nr:hypothetical protein [Planctomycetota bacterium]